MPVVAADIIPVFYKIRMISLVCTLVCINEVWIWNIVINGKKPKKLLA